MKKNRGIDLARLLKTYLTFLSLSITIVVMGLLLMTPPLSAQDATESIQAQDKPQLVMVDLSQNKNNEKVLKIAAGLDKYFFQDKEKEEKQFKDAYYFANFIPLDTRTPERFIIVTTVNNPNYCTGYGCPFYIYEHNNNNWTLVLSTQAHSLLYDKNSKNKNALNLISQHSASTGSPLQLWMWNGQYYKNVNKGK